MGIDWEGKGVIAGGNFGAGGVSCKETDAGAGGVVGGA